MKNTVFILVALLFAQKLNASDWIIHGAIDNTVYASVSSNQVCISDGTTVTCGTEWSAACTFDYWFDQQNPEWADSGAQSSVIGLEGMTPIVSVVGWQENYVLTIGEVEPAYSVTSIQYEFTSFAGVGGPNWENWQEVILPPLEGDYWIDFASDQTGRISITRPVDFGKWAWDGSVNPSWVEPPPAPVQQGKRLAKGHSK